MSSAFVIYNFSPHVSFSMRLHTLGMVIDTLPGSPHWDCEYAGPLPVYSGLIFPNNFSPSGGSVQVLLCVWFSIASAFRLGYLSFRAVHIALSCFLHLFVRPQTESFLFVLIIQFVSYIPLFGKYFNQFYIHQQKCQQPGTKVLLHQQFNSNNPGNKHRIECLKMLAFVLKKLGCVNLSFYRKA